MPLLPKCLKIYTQCTKICKINSMSIYFKFYEIYVVNFLMFKQICPLVISIVIFYTNSISVFSLHDQYYCQYPKYCCEISVLSEHSTHVTTRVYGDNIYVCKGVSFDKFFSFFYRHTFGQRVQEKKKSF